MTPEIKNIVLSMPLGLKTVNCYLLSTPQGYILIDTGSPNARRELLDRLQHTGCTPGSLEAILLTHGDFDHIGNAAFLREHFKTRLAMHEADAAKAKTGDMFHDRKNPGFLIRMLVPLIIGFHRRDRFAPDLLLDDGYNLAQFGLDARIVHIPGHSSGSIGILTSSGELFCGDLFENTTSRPALNSLMDDMEEGTRSMIKLLALPINTIFPGHGPAFSMDRLVK